LKSTIRIKEDEVAKLKTDVEAANDKMTKEVAELKRISREQMRLTEDGFAQTKTRQDKEIQELAGKVGKLETEKLDCQKDILDLQHERNQSSDREKKAVEDMLEARNEVAKTSEKFADLQAEVAGASKRLNEANNKTVQESKDKQVYIEKLTQLEQNHNKTVNLLKQAIRKMAEDKQFFQEPDGTVITDKDIQ
jgi:chromosome segregation ATPase